MSLHIGKLNILPKDKTFDGGWLCIEAMFTKDDVIQEGMFYMKDLGQLSVPVLDAALADRAMVLWQTKILLVCNYSLVETVLAAGPSWEDGNDSLTSVEINPRDNDLSAGNMYNWTDCPDCGGDGINPWSGMACPRCDGNGYVPSTVCMRCEGTTVDPDTGLVCTDCDGFGQIPLPARRPEDDILEKKKQKLRALTAVNEAQIKGSPFSVNKKLDDNKAKAISHMSWEEYLAYCDKNRTSSRDTI